MSYPVVMAGNSQEQEKIVITVYAPDQSRWDEGFRVRKNK